MKLIGITLPYLMAAAFVLVTAHWGGSRLLGAHPFWAEKIAWIGAPFGLFVALLLRHRSWFNRIVAFAVLLSISGAAAHFGRLRFAASFAEDQLAGQFWFFGWIAVAAFLTALIAAALTPGARQT